MHSVDPKLLLCCVLSKGSLQLDAQSGSIVNPDTGIPSWKSYKLILFGFVAPVGRRSVVWWCSFEMKLQQLDELSETTSKLRQYSNWRKQSLSISWTKVFMKYRSTAACKHCM